MTTAFRISPAEASALRTARTVLDRLHRQGDDALRPICAAFDRGELAVPEWIEQTKPLTDLMDAVSQSSHYIGEVLDTVQEENDLCALAFEDITVGHFVTVAGARDNRGWVTHIDHGRRSMTIAWHDPEDGSVRSKVLDGIMQGECW